jgi:hypothetical protein
MATNDDLNRILKDIGLFQAEYLKNLAEDKPERCKLPDVIPGAVNLPPIDLPDITKICAPLFIEFPVIPEPFALPESCENGIQIQTKNVDILSIPGGPVVAQVPIGAHQDVEDFCKYILDIPPVVIPCFPLGPQIFGSARISVQDLNTGTSETTEISLTPDPNAACRWILDGDTTIVIPEIPCKDGINFTTGLLKIHSTCPAVPAQLKATQIVRGNASCTYDIKMPEITIPCYPNGPQVHGDIKVNLSDRDVPFNTQTVGFTSPTNHCCDFKLDGDIDIDIPCHNGITFNDKTWNIKSTPTTTPDRSFSKTIKVKKHNADICDFDIEFPDIVIPCFPDGIVYDGSITFNTTDGPIDDKIDLNAAKDNVEDCKWHLGDIEINLPIPSCPGGISFSSNIVFKANAGTIIPFVDPLDVEGHKRYHNLEIRPAGGDPKDCGAILDGTIDIGLPPFVLNCDALVLGGNRSMTVTFNPGITTPPVIGLRTLDSGCGFEFLDTTLNLPVLACGPATPFSVTTDWKVFSGTQQISTAQNTTNLRPKYPSSPHCGLVLSGELHLPESGNGGFNYLPWTYWGDGGDDYAQGDVASMVFPEGGRCAYRAMSPDGAAVGVSPTHPEAKEVWQGLGCVDEKVFPPFKVIKAKPPEDFGPALNNTYVKVVPRSYLFKDVNASSSLSVTGLDVPFSLDPGNIVYLEVVFEAAGDNINVIGAHIARGTQWDNNITAGDKVIPGVYDKLFKLLRPAEASAIANTTFNRGEIGKYTEILSYPAAERGAAVDALEGTHIMVLNTVAQAADDRPRQFKAYLLIAKAGEGKVPADTTDVDEIEGVILKKDDRVYAIEQILSQHLLLVAKNVDNVPILLPEPFTGNVPKLSPLATPTIHTSVNGDKLEFTFTMPTTTDILGKLRSVGVKSEDIHIYFTIDGTPPTINTDENPGSRLYDGTTQIINLANIRGGISYMAIASLFKRSNIKAFTKPT